MRNFHKYLIFTICSCLFLFPVLAQKPVDKKPAATTQKFKPPKLFISLGAVTDSSTVSVARAESIITMPLKIVDAKNEAYKVTSYQFLYKRKVVTEDEGTGKVSPATSISSERFTTTPLPELWVNTIKERINSGEELFFFDVIVKDAKGRIMYAPNLKILVQ